MTPTMAPTAPFRPLHPQVLATFGALKHHAVLLIHRSFASEAPLAPQVLEALLQGVAQPPPHFDPRNHPDIWEAPLGRPTLRKEDVAPAAQLALYPPQQLARRVFVLHRCQRMGAGAANSLLKTLEEPPVPSLFVLTAPSEQGVLKTISSRCQTIVVRFRGPPPEAPPLLEANDGQWVLDTLQFLWGAPPPVGPSLRQGPFPPPGSPNLALVAKLMPRLEKLAKAYPALVLRDALAQALAQGWKTWGHHEPFRIQARFVAHHLAQWSRADSWNGSSLLWLQTIFLRCAWADKKSQNT